VRSYVLGVAAGWFLPPAQEPLAAEALRMLRGFSSGTLRLLVPDLFWAEMGNILWKAVRLGRLKRGRKKAGVADEALKTRREAERSPGFLRLAHALSALDPKESDEKRLLDAMLLAAPR